jgi:hypothetical protein
MVTVPPEPCEIVIDWLPVVAFSMIHTLLMVLGPSVTVRVSVRDTLEVILRYIPRAPSAVPSGIVNVVLVSVAIALVP